MAGLLKPTSGEIYLNNKNIKLFKREEFARLVAFVPQNFYINFPFTVAEIVATGRYPWKKKFEQLNSKDYKCINNAISICELNSLKHKTILNLSGGERQRTVFARALAQDSDILLLDEATSNLDIKHTLKIFEYLKYSKKNVISIFHDLNLAKLYSDKIIMLKQGNIFDYGNTKEIFNLKNLSELFEVSEKTLEKLIVGTI